MNILIIYSSPRRKSITSILLSEMEKNISINYVIDSFNINKMNFKPCIGCLKCRPNKSCALPEDDAHELSRKIKDFVY